jgi:hypothetical protein
MKNVPHLKNMPLAAEERVRTTPAKSGFLGPISTRGIHVFVLTRRVPVGILYSLHRGFAPEGRGFAPIYPKSDGLGLWEGGRVLFELDIPCK